MDAWIFYIEIQTGLHFNLYYVVEECIREGVLAEFFRAHKSEVISMGIYDFNEEEWEEVVREESIEDFLKETEL